MSKFSQVLTNLFDQSFFTRDEWAKITSVQPAVLQSWLDDIAVPRSYALNLILLTCQNSSDINPIALANFVEMCNLPARQVSPHGKLMLPTVMEYLKRPVFSDLSSQLAKLDLIQQTELLDRIYPDDVETNARSV